MLHLLDLFNNGKLCPLLFATITIYVVAGAATANQYRASGFCQAIAGMVALGFGWHSWNEQNPTDTSDLLDLVVRCLLAGTIAFSLCRFGVSTIDFLNGTLVQAPWRGFRAWLSIRGYVRQRRREERQRRRQEQRQREEEKRLRPEYERLERERREQKQREEDARQRRQEARSGCEMLYNLHAPEIASRLPRSLFDDMVKRLLREELDAELVERKAAELQRLVLQHLERVAPTPKVITLQDVQAWYEEEKQRLAQVNDEDLRDSLLAALHAKYHERVFAILDHST